MIETISPPGSGPTYHAHSREDETFYVVEGEADIWVGDQVHHCKAGDHIYSPADVFHTYRSVGGADMKMIITYSPGGFEQSFLDAEEILQSGKTLDDVAPCVRAVAARIGSEPLGARVTSSAPQMGNAATLIRQKGNRAQTGGMAKPSSTLMVFSASIGGWWLLDTLGFGLVPFPRGDGMAMLILGCTAALLMGLDEIRQAVSASRPPT
jgi:hypothetical protein